MESELANLTQRFTALGQTRDEEKATIEVTCAEASNKVNDLGIRLM